MKYRDEDMLIERCHKLSDCPCATSLHRPRTLDTGEYLASGEQERKSERAQMTSLLPLPDFYCLSRTVRAGAADGPRPDEFRLSALLTGLSSS